MADNFPSALLILGGVGVGVHYEQIVKLYGGVPIIMAYGHPVSGKSTTVNAAMAVIGQQDNIGGNNSLIIYKFYHFRTDNRAIFGTMGALLHDYHLKS